MQFNTERNKARASSAETPECHFTDCPIYDQNAISAFPRPSVILLDLMEAAEVQKL